jgi:hypothetical protein
VLIDLDRRALAAGGTQRNDFDHRATPPFVLLRRLPGPVSISGQTACSLTSRVCERVRYERRMAWRSDLSAWSRAMCRSISLMWSESIARTELQGNWPALRVVMICRISLSVRPRLFALTIKASRP